MAWFDRHCGLLICARVSDCHGSLLLSNWRVVIHDILWGRSQAGANSSVKKKTLTHTPSHSTPTLLQVES